MAKVLLKAAAAVFFLWVLYLYLDITLRGTPWDLETYYYAAQATQQGLNPYDTNDLAMLAQRPVGMPYVNPPGVLLLFTPFTYLSVTSLDGLGRAVTAVLLGVLGWIWASRFLPRVDRLLIAIALIFGFDSAAIWTLKVGNLSILEAALLWIAFAFYLARRQVLFATALVLASMFKMIPIVFLGLLFAVPQERRARFWIVGAAVAILTAVAVLPIWLGPAWAHGYFHHLPSIRTTGAGNPSALGLLDALLGTTPASLLAWALYALGIAVLSLGTIRTSWTRHDKRLLVLEAVYLYVLLSPRPMIYSYLLLIPSAIVFGDVLFRHMGGKIVTVAILIAPSIWKKFGINTHGVFWDNYPFLVALAIWLGHVWGPRRQETDPAAARSFTRRSPSKVGANPAFR